MRDSGVLGVGQTALAEDFTDALRRLNMMISQWNRRRWLVYHLVETTAQCDGSLFYTIGPTLDFNVARPDRIEYAFIRQTVASNPTPIDWPLQILNSYENYAAIAIKTLAASPSEYLFYDSGFPTGKVYPWPLPNSQYEIHILTKSVLQSFATGADTVVLPPEYEEAILYNLIIRLRAAYRLPPDATYVGLAKAGLNTLRRANAQVSTLGMPMGLRTGPAYNVFSDRGW